MRKTKILAVFGILLAMGITACNKSSTNKSSSSEEHTHSFGSWTEVTPATCTEKGSKERVCACGEKETGEIPALGHDFENGTVTADTSTCTADGKQTVKCSRCDATQQVDVKAHHKFGAETKVDKTGTADVDYYTATCSVDQALQIRFPTEVGGVYSGTTRKSGTPSGYTKLTGDGSISWTINVAGTKGYMGKMYHKACMDAFPSNKEKNYQYYDSRSSNVRDSGNFNFYVNGQLTDKSAYMDISFDDLTKDGEVDPALAEITDSPGPYSPVALCPLADNVYIQPGTNVFKYERTGSYNMVMSDLVFIGTEYVHAHNNNTTDFASDENQHWNVCTAVGCPSNGKVNVANHTFEEVAPADDTETDVEHKARAATCSEEGIKVEVCSVCQYRKESPINKLPHTFAEDGGWTVNTPATCDAAGERQHQCTVCEAIVKEVIPALGHDFSGGVAQAYEAGEGFIASDALNCVREGCNKSALRWSALDYDVAKSTAASDEGKLPTLKDNDKAIQLDTSVTQGMGDDHSAKGCHVIYNVKVPEEVENAGLAMLATQAPYGADMFDQMQNENSRGYYQNAEGEWVVPDSRYGIKVDGTEYLVAKNNGAIKGAGTTWYQFPGISLTLTAGIHEIEIFKYGGYDVQNYEFMLIGLSHVTPAHQHTYSEWETNETNHWKVCTGEGCLDPEGTKYLDEKHDFGELQVVTPNSCEADGTGKYVCQTCGYEKPVVIKADHAWGDATPVAGSDGKADYNKFVCSACGAIKLEVELKESMITGTNKNDPAGYIKLKNANDYFSFSFDYPFSGDNNLAYGKIYQRGVMDGWNSNKGKNLFSGGTNGADDFELLLNGNKVDVSAYKNQTFEQVMTGEPQAGDLSALTDVESGIIQLNNGENTVKYTRLASFNLALTHIVFVIKEAKHTHNPASTWTSDENQHWHACDVEGCPDANYKDSAANHTWVADTSKTDIPSTCTVQGTKYEKCEVCGREREVKLALADHSYDEGTAFTNSQEKTGTKYACANCGGIRAEMDLMQADDATTIADGKLGHSTTYTWRFKVGDANAVAGKVTFYMHLKRSGSNSTNIAEGYSLKSGDVNGTIDSAFINLRVGTGYNQLTKVGEITIANLDANGEIVIQLTTPENQGYRPDFRGNVEIVIG